jgi:hypothetical protein
MEGVVVEKLRKRDLGNLLLIARVHYPRDAWLTEEYVRELFDCAVAALAIRWNGRLVGGAIVTEDKTPNLWLDLMVIDRNVTGRGLGEKLFISLERELASGMVLWHLLPDGKAFKPSQTFLSEMEMERAGSLEGWFGPRANGLAYRKKIR